MIRALVLTLCLCGLAVPAAAAAAGADAGAEASAARAAPDQSLGFVAADRPAKVPGGRLMISAYALVWLVLFGYLFSIWRRLQGVQQELKELAGEVKSMRSTSGEAS